MSRRSNERFRPSPASPFPAGLDEKIWKWYDNLDSPVLDVHASRKSHILITACAAEEAAKEKNSDGYTSGVFTTLLLKVFRQCNLTSTTYLHLSDILLRQENKLTNQTPSVQGLNKNRILFSTTEAGPNNFSVSLNDQTFSVAAGLIHGVDEKTEFIITSGRTFKLIAAPRTGTVSATTCNLKLLLSEVLNAAVTGCSRPLPPSANIRSEPLDADGLTFSVTAGSAHEVDKDTTFTITGRNFKLIITPRTVSASTCWFNLLPSEVDGLRAEVSTWNRPLLSIFFSKSIVFDGTNLKLGPLSKLVDQRESADLALKLSSNGNMLLERRDPLLSYYAEQFISIPRGYTTSPDPIFDAISRFKFYLYHQPNFNRPVKDNLIVKLELIGTPKDNMPDNVGPIEPNFFSTEVGERLKKPDLGQVTGSSKITDFVSQFCLTLSLTSKFSRPLYPYVFVFDPATYQIVVCQLYY